MKNDNDIYNDLRYNMYAYTTNITVSNGTPTISFANIATDLLAGINIAVSPCTVRQITFEPLIFTGAGSGTDYNNNFAINLDVSHNFTVWSSKSDSGTAINTIATMHCPTTDIGLTGVNMTTMGAKAIICLVTSALYANIAASTFSFSISNANTGGTISSTTYWKAVVQVRVYVTIQ